MSEYTFVEKPFLTQLHNLGWDIIEHPNGVIPTDPTVSLRNDFKEVMLKDTFKTSLKKINATDSGIEWLNDSQLEELYTVLSEHSHKELLEANKEVFELLIGKERTTVDRNEITGEEYPSIKFIDFKEPENNDFLAINQFRIDTTGTAKNFIIPDIVLFVNGIPLGVVECKYTNEHTSNPMEEGIRQLLRYSNQRLESEGIVEKEGEEKLFHFNQLMISTYGDEARFGTISASYEHYLEWKDIYPLKYKEFEPPLGEVRSQEKLIQGMLAPETFLDIIKHFTVFMQTNDTTIKVTCRYQQYRAVYKAIERLLRGDDPFQRSGVIWHTQGSGKSLTMVFLVRKIRSIDELKEYKVVVINDRTDLEEQLGGTMTLTGETVDYAENTDELKSKGATQTSNLLMVMVHKFLGRDNYIKPDVLVNALKVAEESMLPQYTTFEEINTSEKILILVDEAHRTQSSTLGMNVFRAFPNASRIAFTGTPLITERHKKKTHETFGSYIDTYKLQDAVNDGATVQILYEGKTVDTAINERAEFDNKFEDLFRERTEQEILLIKKKYGTLGDILEAEKRIEAIAKDIVKHYIDNILPNGFKAQVVTSSKLAAVRYQKAIEKALQERVAEEEAKSSVDLELLKQLKFIKTAVVVSSDGTNEDPQITRVRKNAREVNAIDNFKKKFDYDDPDKKNTGIAFIIVCDMLLTGFDAPIEQVMYIDKKMVEHNLLQAIARVNRNASGKSRGYIVDYIGIGNHLHEALKIYGGGDYEDTIGSMQDINTEIPILRDRYYRLLDLFKSRGIDRIQEYVEYEITDPAEQYQILEVCIDLLADIHIRASFDVHYKKFLQSMDIILPNPAANNYVGPMKAFGHIHNKTRHRYKDNSFNIAGVGKKVKKLINEHLISLGVDPKVPPVELLSKDFKDALNKSHSTKAKASEMEHAIRKHCKVNFESDPILYERFSEKLQKIINAYKDDLEERYNQLMILFEEIREGRGTDKETEGLDPQLEAPFYDLLLIKAFKEKDKVTEEIKEQLKIVVKDIVALIRRTIKIIDFWHKGYEQDMLKAEIDDMLLFSNIDEVIEVKEQITCDFMELAKRKHSELVK
ncbi:HsdR family type I site-specific deoxyribonuclease [uncultured Tissierella sp.]|uniref:type I restriction endonuclease subunit R n=1 Tax=uncultured Tissierella sp. TaxID=448160 RepID=UPI0028064C92|nr:HsdR family type I site-specific deoxyribonuclease [uncultured Tissierella sp.]MDU5082734.1 HsdR family type I site-specific deoxyribonuclease [Bacillota bacterium]